MKIKVPVAVTYDGRMGSRL